MLVRVLEVLEQPCDRADQASTYQDSQEAGSITDRYDYSAFSTLRSQSGSTANPYRYTDQQFDGATELYSLRARYYQPTVGRFLSRDMAGVDVVNPREFNRYGYVAGDPVNGYDPSGLFFAETARLYDTQAVITAAVYTVGVTVSAIFIAEFAELCSRTDGAYILCARKGKEKGENPATREAKQRAQGTMKTPCQILEEMLQAATDNKEIQVIVQAQKYLGCRNGAKRRK